MQNTESHSYIPSLNCILCSQVLTTGIIYMDNKKNKSATQRNIFKRLLKQSKVKKEQDIKYLQCFDTKGLEIMIPLIMSGVFSPVGDASMANYDAVYELQDLIMAFGLPVNAQLIHCNAFEGFKCPKGVIRLYGTREEEVVVVNRVGSNGILFEEKSNKDNFEMPVDQECLFQRGVVKKTPAIKARLVDVFQSHLPVSVSSKESSDSKFKDHNKRIMNSSSGGSRQEPVYIKKTQEKDFKVRHHQDRRFSTPVNQRSKPITANYHTAASANSSPSHSTNTNVITQKDPHSNSTPVSPRRESTPSTSSGLDFSLQSASFENPAIIDSTAVIYKSPSSPTSRNNDVINTSPTSSSSSSKLKEKIYSSKNKQSKSNDTKASPTYESKSKSPLSGEQISSGRPSSTTPKDLGGNDIELPERAPRELKKSKSTTSILDKLSVRKVKKERAKLKELRSDDVFSRRIVRNGLSYQDFFNGLGRDDEGGEKKEERAPSPQNEESSTSSGVAGNSQNQNRKMTSNTSPTSGGGGGGVQEPDGGKSHDNSYNSLLSRRQSVQQRDLPPIPPDSPNNLSHSPAHHEFINESKDSLYEHLPPAPTPPLATHPLRHQGEHDEDEEDGYMMPIQLREEQKKSSYPGEKYEVKMRDKSNSYYQDDGNRYAQSGRTRKTRSAAISSDYHQGHQHHDDGCPIDIDRLFSFAYNNNNNHARESPSTDFNGRPLGPTTGQLATSTSQLYGPMARGLKDQDVATIMGQIDHRFMDNLDLEMRSGQQGSRYRSKQSRNMNANPNATIRSHNLRKMRPSALELFHFSDSFRDIRSPDFHCPNLPNQDNMNSNNGSNANGGMVGRIPPPIEYSQHTGMYPGLPVDNNQSNNGNVYSSRPPLLNSRSVEGPSGYAHQQNFYGSAHHPYGYAESEPPCFRQGHRPSIGGMLGGGGGGGGGSMINEALYLKQGDDSAISLCSRGDGGFPNESEYSYNEYAEQTVLEDGWTPPDSVDGMSVQEVAKSLRYIGMKDRVVLRFSNEQIDGSMLCTLDKKLLQEGFPELNALELKKILDFVQGWRPKKR